MITKKTARKTGEEAEDLACEHLEKQGLKLITRNFYCRLGEIDLIMQDENHLVFVEVRYRKNANYGSGIESITASKKMKLWRTAQFYLQRFGLTEKVSCRFDVIGITLEKNAQIEWIKNAFTN